jgi:hypothetical protein
MNKVMHDALVKVRRDSYEKGYIGKGKDVRVRKFSDIYSALSDKKSTYETRLEHASKLAKQRSLSLDEVDYINTLMAGTADFMSAQRAKRGKDAVESTYLSYTAPKRGIWSKAKRFAATAGIAASLLFASVALSYNQDSKPKQTLEQVVKKEAAKKQSSQYIIAPLDVNVYNPDGSIFRAYTGKTDNSKVQMPRGGSFEVIAPKTACKDGNKDCKSLDMMVRDDSNHYIINKNPTKGKSKRVYELKFNDVDSKKYTVDVLAEKGKEILARAGLVVEVVEQEKPAPLAVVPELPAPKEQPAPVTNKYDNRKYDNRKVVIIDNRKMIINNINCGQKPCEKKDSGYDLSFGAGYDKNKVVEAYGVFSKRFKSNLSIGGGFFFGRKTGTNTMRFQDNTVTVDNETLKLTSDSIADYRLTEYGGLARVMGGKGRIRAGVEAGVGYQKIDALFGLRQDALRLNDNEIVKTFSCENGKGSTSGLVSRVGGVVDINLVKSKDGKPRVGLEGGVGIKINSVYSINDNLGNRHEFQKKTAPYGQIGIRISF